MFGKSVEEATNRALTLELLARMNWLATPHKDPGEISQIDKDEMARRYRVEQEARARGTSVDAAMHPGGFEGEGRGGGWDALTAMLASGEYAIDDLGMGIPFA